MATQRAQQSRGKSFYSVSVRVWFLSYRCACTIADAYHVDSEDYIFNSKKAKKYIVYFRTVTIKITNVSKCSTFA